MGCAGACGQNSRRPRKEGGGSHEHPPPVDAILSDRRERNRRGVTSAPRPTLLKSGAPGHDGPVSIGPGRVLRRAPFGRNGALLGYTLWGQPPHANAGPDRSTCVGLASRPSPLATMPDPRILVGGHPVATPDLDPLVTDRATSRSKSLCYVHELRGRKPEAAACKEPRPRATGVRQALTSVVWKELSPCASLYSGRPWPKPERPV
jgi:hypothetical protein